jgi:hypothetical protein
LDHSTDLQRRVVEHVTDIQYIQYPFLNGECHKHSKVSLFGLSETESLVADI